MAVGDRTESRLFGPSVVANTDTTLGTVPSSRVWVFKQLIFTNTNSSEAWITVSIGSTSTIGNAVFYEIAIPAKDTVIFNTALVLSASETIQAVSSVGGINVIANGWVKEV